MDTFRRIGLLPAAVALTLAAVGCNSSGGTQDDLGPHGAADLSFVFTGSDGDTPQKDDGGGGTNACGDSDPSCMVVSLGCTAMKQLPLPNDKPADPNVAGEGLGRDPKTCGLVLDSSVANFDYLWIANTEDAGGRGTVSKMNSKLVRETARYYSVTCNSLKGVGSQKACDGKTGCCAADSWPQFQNRLKKLPSGQYQQVLLLSNAPSRTAVDFNGDMWIANRAFGGQSSATKIANDPSSCIDRNGNGKIDTSKDVNNDGVIQIDCNEDMVPDDLANVKAKACKNGMAQEFYGLDDECVLLTTNTNVPDVLGRPLSLGPGALDFGASDAWAGTFEDGKFFRIDGTTGLTKDFAQLPNGCQPYGLVVDSAGYGWSGNLSEPPLCYFNTKKTSEVGQARPPTVGTQEGYGIALDRDQNVWLACLSFGACRYTPDRQNGFAGLGKGYWTMVSQPGTKGGAGGYGIGIAVDSRAPNLYFAWMAGDNRVVRIPASALALPGGKDVLVDGAAYPSVTVGGDGKGVGVDRDQNVWNVSGSGDPQAGATRILVDAAGKMTAPDIQSQPKGQNLCPAGDRCAHQGNNPWDPQPYTYSDFTGFGLRNFTKPKGTYSYLVKGCMSGDTKWVKVAWDSDVPPNTTLGLRARSGKTAVPDNTWGAWSPIFAATPADLVGGMPLGMNPSDSGYLQIQFELATTQKGASPRLRGFEVAYSCGGTPG
ncbi:MAG: hypothetical protein EXR72_09520 [Myxococcales bacterium]|nr:hypothetical protein [Myxococcales bacterium]